jgi:alpha-methylacyl-CoA racemase
VLAFGEVAAHPHLDARATIVDPGGVPQAAPAPRFSRTSPVVPGAAGDPEPVEAVLEDWA